VGQETGGARPKEEKTEGVSAVVAVKERLKVRTST
jgi:hypothetical protein